MSDEKTEEPTDKKLDDAKKKGQSPKSPDVNAAAGMLAMLLCLGGGASLGGTHLVKLFSIFYEHGVAVQTDAQVAALIFDLVREGLLAIVPFVGASILAGLVASFLQVGVQITFEPLVPKFDKLDPVAGVKKIFSLRSLIDFGKMIVKAIALGSVAYLVCRSLMPLLIGASRQSPEGVIAVAWAAMLKLVGAATIVFLVIGPGDFILQKWLFIRDQRMSKDDIKREHKDAEGDPQLKGQRKQLASEMVNEAPPRVAVPRATVVVANPTHFAVALRYVPGETALPIVLAKGVDDAALEIRALAEDSRVPVVVNPPLARALHKLPVGASIPDALFEAVAGVLRWVRTMKAVAERLESSDEGDVLQPGDVPSARRSPSASKERS